MDQTINKVFWKIGQEITPQTFIQADNYICNQYNLIRRLIADKSYGMLPQTETDTPSLSVKANLNNGNLYIEQLDCHGTTEAGYLALFKQNLLASLPKQQLSIHDSNAPAFYVVLRINPYEQVLIEPIDNAEAPEAHSAYELDIRALNEIAANELAILKINNNNHSPAIDLDYIPPCMSVNSCAGLREIFDSVKQLFIEIQAIMEAKIDQFEKILFPLALLQHDLEVFPLSNPPIALVRLIKKIMTTYQFFVPDIRKIRLPDVLGEYSQNDVAITFKSLLSYLNDVKLIVGNVEFEEEDFTPKI